MVPIGAEPHYGILVIASLSAVALRGAEVVMSRVAASLPEGACRTG